MTDVPLVDNNSLETEVVLLWDKRAPAGTGDSLLDQPLLSVHCPASGNGCGVIVCPGGGYRTLASDHEGLQVARWLNRLGIAAFVLRYRLGPAYHSSVSLLDAKRAMRFVRAHAPQYRLDADRIGMLGFSAGGHLICAVGVDFDHGDPASDDPVERYGCRPDFLVPVYAVTNGKKRGRKVDEYPAVDEAVTPQTPPSFIVATHEDTVVPANQSTLLYDALLGAGVDAELHIFSNGEHGLGLMPGDPDCATWTELFARWARRQGLLTNASRIEVRGTLLIDGMVPSMAWITFVPEDKNCPIARVRINRASAGNFSVPLAKGPTVGWHEMQIHHVSDQFPYTGTGRYTLLDATQYRARVYLDVDGPLDLHLTRSDFDSAFEETGVPRV